MDCRTGGHNFLLILGIPLTGYDMHVTPKKIEYKLYCTHLDQIVAGTQSHLRSVVMTLVFLFLNPVYNSNNTGSASYILVVTVPVLTTPEAVLS